MMTSMINMMRKNKITLVMLLVGFVVGAGLKLAGVDPMKLVSSDLREPSSVAQASFASKPRFLSKGFSIATVTLTAPQGVPSEANQDLVVNADVEFSGSYDNIEYKWILPEGAEVVSGVTSDEWTQVKEGQVAHAQITLQNVSKDQGNRTVMLQVYTKHEDTRLMAAGIFTTDSSAEQNQVSSSQTLKAQSEESTEAPSGKDSGIVVPKGVHF